jgi:hypothetical protein
MGVIDILIAIFAYYTIIVSIVTILSIKNVFHIIRAHYESSDEMVAQTFQRSEEEYRLMYSPTICKKHCTDSDSIQFIHENHICSICLEVHWMHDCIQTVCGHIYGQLCFQEWIKHGRTDKYILCPNCKRSVTSVTEYLSG